MIKSFFTYSLIFIVWGIFILIIFKISKDFSYSNNIKLEEIAQFGDSFNILTSLFTGLAFSAVLISIRLQKEELIKVSKEMISQSFDNKFFQMLNLFNNLIDSLSFNGHGQGIHEKRKVFKKLKNIFEDKYFRSKEGFEIEFYRLNQEYDTTFKFYFINLYQILKYVDKQFDNDIERAKNYTNIVRAQLSKDELVLLFYNAMGVIPFSGENYKNLVEKYAFFEHLTYTDLNSIGNRPFVDELLKKYDLSAFGKNEDLKNKVLEIQKSLL